MQRPAALGGRAPAPATSGPSGGSSASPTSRERLGERRPGPQGRRQPVERPGQLRGRAGGGTAARCRQRAADHGDRRGRAPPGPAPPTARPPPTPWPGPPRRRRARRVRGPRDAAGRPGAAHGEPGAGRARRCRGPDRARAARPARAAATRHERELRRSRRHTAPAPARRPAGAGGRRAPSTRSPSVSGPRPPTVAGRADPRRVDHLGDRRHPAPGARRPRTTCTTRSTAPAIWLRTAASGTPASPSSAIVSTRRRASAGPLAWQVDRHPPWPVFMACTMSSASAPRTSPTTMRSGRMRRAARTRSRTPTAARPSAVAGPGLEPHDVVARQPELGRVLDGHDALARRQAAGTGR